MPTVINIWYKYFIKVCPITKPQNFYNEKSSAMHLSKHPIITVRGRERKANWRVASCGFDDEEALFRSDEMS